MVLKIGNREITVDRETSKTLKLKFETLGTTAVITTQTVTLDKAETQALIAALKAEAPM